MQDPQIDIEVPFRLTLGFLAACLLGGAVWFFALVGALSLLGMFR